MCIWTFKQKFHKIVLRKFIFFIEYGDSVVKEFVENKETKSVVAKSSKFRTEITGRFISS